MDNTTEQHKTTKDYLNETLAQTQTAITKLFDTVDSIDRKIYGRRMKFFIWGSIWVLIVAPLLDELLGVDYDRLTYYSTLIFLVFVLVVVLAFIGAWRDDSGNWTWNRAKSRLLTYYETSKDEIAATKTNGQDETIYKIGRVFFIGGIAWKAFQNLSVFVRKPIENLFGTRLSSFRDFERFTNHYYWVVILIGAAIMFYLYKKNPQILLRIKAELRQLFGWENSEDSKYTDQVVTIQTNTDGELVINAKTDGQVNAVIAKSNSTLFNDFVVALQNWHPKGAYYEYEYQDRLYRHLKKHLPGASVELEYPIADAAGRGRADIVVNDTILIEMKRDSSAGAIQRAKGQVSQYSEIWQGRGPVILLLCNYNYEHARTAFTPTMNDLAKLQRPALTIVATQN